MDRRLAFKIFMVVVVLRIGMGVAWIQAGYPKLSDPAWGPDHVRSYIEKAVLKTQASSRTWIYIDYLVYDAYNWYAQWAIIHSGAYRWLAPLIAWGEVLIGLAWVSGCLIRPTAILSLVLTLHLAFSDSVRTNMLFALASILLACFSLLASSYVRPDLYILSKILPQLTKMRFSLPTRGTST